MGSYLIISVIGGFLMLALADIGLWAVGNSVMDEGLLSALYLVQRWSTCLRCGS
ncbi:hypothetical protein RCO48_17615 [Peribacillus frigoritolerans]|nr:hypothetical protein [Peribacillus frigoritolerans]